MDDMHGRRLIPEHEIMVSILAHRCHNIDGRLSFNLLTGEIGIILLGTLP